MMNSLREIFDENSETNKRMRKQAEEWKQESIREKSCPSCRYADLIDDGQGYSHYECRLRKKKTLKAFLNNIPPRLIALRVRCFSGDIYIVAMQNDSSQKEDTNYITLSTICFILDIY